MGPLDDRDLRHVEDWFLDRGTPHLIEGYSARQDVLTRMVPLLSLVALLEVIAAGDLEWRWWQNVLAALGGLVVLVAAVAVVNRLRGRPALARPDRLGPVELGLFLLGPPAIALGFGHPDQALAVVAANAALFPIAYLVTSYGLLPLTRWATVRMVREIAELAGVLARALPLLLLFVTFLFVNTEVWQVAEAMDWPILAVVLGLFVVIGVAVLLTRLPGEIDTLTRFEDPREAERLCEGTPAAGWPAAGSSQTEAGSLTRRQRVNVLLVVLFSQAVQILAVTAMVFAFFVAFGALAIRPEVIEAWVGDAALAETVAQLDVGGTTLVVTAALVRVAAFLAAFSGFYFTVYVVTDDVYRRDFLDDVLAEVRQTFAVRTAYLAGLAGLAAGTGAPVSGQQPDPRGAASATASP